MKTTQKFVLFVVLFVFSLVAARPLYAVSFDNGFAVSVRSSVHERFTPLIVLK